MKLKLEYFKLYYTYNIHVFNMFTAHREWPGRRERRRSRVPAFPPKRNNQLDRPRAEVAPPTEFPLSLLLIYPLHLSSSHTFLSSRHGSCDKDFVPTLTSSSLTKCSPPEKGSCFCLLFYVFPIYKDLCGSRGYPPFVLSFVCWI